MSRWVSRIGKVIQFGRVAAKAHHDAARAASKKVAYRETTSLMKTARVTDRELRQQRQWRSSRERTERSEEEQRTLSMSRWSSQEDP